MKITVEVKNEILGDSVFWTGDEKDINQISNIVARRTARLVAKDGLTRKEGMWVVSIDGGVT